MFGVEEGVAADGSRSEADDRECERKSPAPYGAVRGSIVANGWDRRGGGGWIGHVKKLDLARTTVRARSLKGS